MIIEDLEIHNLNTDKIWLLTLRDRVKNLLLLKCKQSYQKSLFVLKIPYKMAFLKTYQHHLGAATSGTD